MYLGMITPVGWLERVPSYKEMQENLSHKDLTTYGFLGYPVLMASDILLYQPKYVPGGAGPAGARGADARGGSAVQQFL
jgi:tryptophanyl-tRNA synthetase